MTPPAPDPTPARRVKSALFVDFDNIYLGLERVSGPEAARRFADAPERWVRWLARDAHAADPGAPRAQRDILVRRCYLNPIAFGNQRAMFTTSAFQVVDCPPLTRGGKCSTDIHMVMDILDALHHPTHFDEFIILSADADFTPLLLRLRAFDRRTLVVAVGPAAQAYRRACDHLVSDDEFVEKALGLHDAPAPRPAPKPVPRPVVTGRDDILDRAAEAVAERVRNDGPVPFQQFHAVLREAFPREFPNSNWFGCHGLEPLVARLMALQPGLARLTEPDRVGWAPVAAPPAPEPTPADPEQLAAVRDEVLRVVAASDDPVSLAALAHAVKVVFGEGAAGSNWFGAGTFKGLLRQADLNGCLLSEVGPGYLYDPARHAEPTADVKAGPRVDQTHPDLAGIAQRVHQVALTPRLPPDAYAALFGVIADQFRDEFARGEVPSLTTELSRAVRDGCEAAGLTVSRRDVNFVLRGVFFTQRDYPDEVNGLMNGAPSLAAGIGELFRAGVVHACRDRQLDLTPDDERDLRRWLLGGLALPADYGAAAVADTPAAVE